MTEKELKKLNRRQLLELLLKQTQRADELQEELERVKTELEDRARMENQAGSLAEAALKLNDVVEAAQAALNNVSFFEKKSTELESTERQETIEEREDIPSVVEEVAVEETPAVPISAAERLLTEQRENNTRIAENILADIENLKNRSTSVKDR